MSLKNKRILITAGPTWVALDRVRVISNTASGETGIMLARSLRKKGAKVTLVLGPVGAKPEGTMRVLRFTFFDELLRTVEKELAAARYDAVIHSAAVSDYKPERVTRGKLPSDRPKIAVTLVRTPKIIDLIRRKAPSAMLAGFKFLPEASSPRELLAEARTLGKRSGADIVVANTAVKGKYRAFIVSPGGIVPEAGSKKELVGLLEMYLEAFFTKNPAGTGACSCGKCNKKAVAGKAQAKYLP